MEYSKEQLEAINSIDGQVCIISVAGSGKTAVIVARADNIVKTWSKAVKNSCAYIFKGCGSTYGKTLC